MDSGRALVLVVPLVALVTPGCLSNRCLLTYCEGPDCTCSVSSCGEGAAYDDRARQCRCLPGRALVSGQCVAPEVAAAFCGPGYRFENGGCFPAAQCRPGDELDRASGLCIPHDRVNQVAQNMGVNVGVGQRLGCPPGQKLVIEGSNAACVPLEHTCAMDETWNGSACTKTQEGCPQGSAFDAAQGKCVAFSHAPPSPQEGAPAVDVRQWAFTHYGADGGPGAPGFCNAFAGKPWSFGVAAGSTAIVRVQVSLRFADGVLAKGSVATAASFAMSGAPVIPKGAAEVQSSARSILAPLVGSNGRASTPEVDVNVRCAVVNAARPLAVPSTGGL